MARSGSASCASCAAAPRRPHVSARTGSRSRPLARRRSAAGNRRGRRRGRSCPPRAPAPRRTGRSDCADSMVQVAGNSIACRSSSRPEVHQVELITSSGRLERPCSPAATAAPRGALTLSPPGGPPNQQSTPQDRPHNVRVVLATGRGPHWPPSMKAQVPRASTFSPSTSSDPLAVAGGEPGARSAGRGPRRARRPPHPQGRATPRRARGSPARPTARRPGDHAVEAGRERLVRADQVVQIEGRSSTRCPAAPIRGRHQLGESGPAGPPQLGFGAGEVGVVEAVRPFAGPRRRDRSSP